VSPQSIEQKLKHEMEKVYIKQQQKVAKMTRTQTTDTIDNNTKHTIVENYTNIQFTHNKCQLLNKELKYDLHYKN
jgi:thiamine pyrophosphokinase